MGRAKSSEAGALVLKRGGRRDRGGHNAAAKTGFDGLSQAPWRKFPSIFKQPVTLVRTTSRETTSTPAELHKRVKGREKSEYPQGPIFWAKSLEGLRAMIPLSVSDRIRCADDLINANIEQRLALPAKVEPSLDVISTEAACATLCSAIQNCSGTAPALIGQSAERKKVEDNPIGAMNFAQPLVNIPNISDHDIIAQEKRVLDARKRLQELRKSFAIR